VPSANPRVPARVLAGISCLSAAILIVELALTRIFSVTMYYHFAFLAVSIAMFGLGASSVFVYVTPRWHPPERALSHLARYATLFSIVTVVAAVVLIRVRVDLHYSSAAVARLLVV